ncbi:hypothetical protein H6F77_18975 [Microcoleus sp. FACHB-831]|uniref:hypothetical protein n=1 Tax=Microcoleus sp. FACHB-831 TaxID=2692827 RepID=UPI001685AE3C|nr:hypothetical protein [Microcoleus sp. FACHB-831]MBD1923140.1 hypothetical protein [Microcoleus sp. FACHB-831]
MLQLDALPIWTQPAILDNWPTQAVKSDALKYALHLRQGWSNTPQVEETAMQVEHIFAGSHPTEWLIVSSMDNVNPSCPLREWVEAMVLVTGFPILPILSSVDPHPQLLEWEHDGSCVPLARHLSVDEVYLVRGVAAIEPPNSFPALARFYILLARRGKLAWKVTLSFLTVCLPGMPTSAIASNDHVRAGATFGNLRFL